MSAGDFLKSAWGATEQTVQNGLQVASTALETAEDVTVAAVFQGQAILTGVKAAIVAAQVPTYAAAQTAALIFAKASQLFSPQAILNAICPCPLSNQSRLSISLAKDQALLAQAAQRGLQNNPDVMALQKAAKVNAQALMSDDVYHDQATVSIPGYSRLTDKQINTLMGGDEPAQLFNSTSPNFHAALYVSNQSPPQYTLAFRGTDPSQQSDLATDANNALGLQTGSYSNAISLSNQVNRAISRAQGATLEVTGHSLGGGLAQAASARTGAKGNIFNAAGYDPDTMPETVGSDTEDNLVNYHVAGEPLTTVQDSIAGIPVASAAQVSIPGPLNSGLLGLHGMDSVESGMVSIGSGSQSAVSNLLAGL